MILSPGLASPMIALLLDSPKNPVRSLFTFGDSYTSTSFDVSSTQPSPTNPLGNPALGQGTASDGMNWVGYLSTVFNTSLVFSYNMAHYGATVDDSIIYNEPEDLVYQVEHEFRPHYCPASDTGTVWDTDSASFVLWFGINDIQFSYLKPDPFDKIIPVLDSYYQLVQELHACGARRFLLVNVPPTSRTPKMLTFEHWLRELHEKIVMEFNLQLADAIPRWRDHLKLTTIDLYDSWTFMSNVLDNYQEYGFINDSCIGAGCIWWDWYHPRSVFHQLLAADMQRSFDYGSSG